MHTDTKVLICKYSTIFVQRFRPLSGAHAFCSIPITEALDTTHRSTLVGYSTTLTPRFAHPPIRYYMHDRRLFKKYSTSMTYGRSKSSMPKPAHPSTHAQRHCRLATIKHNPITNLHTLHTPPNNPIIQSFVRPTKRITHSLSSLSHISTPPTTLPPSSLPSQSFHPPLSLIHITNKTPNPPKNDQPTNPSLPSLPPDIRRAKNHRPRTPTTHQHPPPHP